MKDMGFNNYCLIGENNEYEIYRQTDIQYGNIDYFAINKNDASDDIESYTVDSIRTSKRKKGTKMTYHINRYLKCCSEDIKMYYNKYNSVFEYAESMALFQTYYDRVIKIADKEYVMKILGICGPDVALAVLCTMFKDGDAIIKRFVKIKQSDKIYIDSSIKAKPTEVDEVYNSIIKEGYVYNKQKLKDLINIIPDEELKKCINTDIIEFCNINVARKLFLDMAEHNDIVLKILLCYTYNLLGEEKFYEIIEYEKKRIRRKK